MFEANPNFVKQAKVSRTQPIINKAVSFEEGQTVSFRIDNGLLGGIVEGKPEIGELIEVQTTTLQAELRKAMLPK